MSGKKSPQGCGLFYFAHVISTAAKHYHLKQ